MLADMNRIHKNLQFTTEKEHKKHKLPGHYYQQKEFATGIRNI
jgi:hypothetical protein